MKRSPAGPFSSFTLFSVVARHGLDGADDLLVGDLVGGAGEGGVAAVHEDGPVVLGVAAQGADQLPPLGVVEGAEVHVRSPKGTKGRAGARPGAGHWDRPVRLPPPAGPAAGRR